MPKLPLQNVGQIWTLLRDHYSASYKWKDVERFVVFITEPAPEVFRTYISITNITRLK
jgi:hypothetical protein